MTDRYQPLSQWVLCNDQPSDPIIHRDGGGCPGPHEPIYRKVSQCTMELRLDWGYLRCEEDEGHGDDLAFPIHAAKDSDGLMIWWQSA